MNWNGKINKLGIFGGTFNPPHIGHLILAAEAHSQMDLDGILWVLTPDPPHKTGNFILPVTDRLDMLRATIKEDKSFNISDVDISRPPPYYAVDTMQLLANKYIGVELNYLIGGDSLRDLPTWHEPKRFLQACHQIGVMERPGSEYSLSTLESLLPGIQQKLFHIHTPLIEISSSDIRRRIKTGLPYRYFLTSEVYEIIQRKNLYQA